MKVLSFMAPPSSSAAAKAILVLALPLLAQSVSAVALLGGLLPGRPDPSSSSSSIEPSPSTSSTGVEGNWPGSYRGWKRDDSDDEGEGGIREWLQGMGGGSNNNNAAPTSSSTAPTSTSAAGNEEENWGLRPWKRAASDGEATTSTAGSVEENWGLRPWKRDSSTAEEASTTSGTTVDGVEGNWGFGNRVWAKRDDDSEVDDETGIEIAWAGGSRAWKKKSIKRDDGNEGFVRMRRRFDTSK